MRRFVGWCAVLLTCVVVPGGAASAASEPPMIEAETPVEITVSDSVGSGSIKVINSAAVPITLGMSADTVDCTWKLDPPVVPARTSQPVKFKVSDCELPKEKFDVSLTSAGAERAILPMKATVPERVESGDIARRFGIGAVLAIIAVLMAWIVFATRPGDEAPVHLGTPLSSLKKDWSFSDSWATSLSAFATLLPALFSTSGLLEALTGAEPKLFLARALVGGAIALFLSGGGTMLVKAIGPTAEPTVFGVLAGGFATLTGVVGQLLTIRWATGEAKFDPTLTALGRYGSLGGVAILLYYGWKSLSGMLEDGTKPAKPEPLDPLFIVAAAMWKDNPQSSAHGLIDAAKALRDVPALQPPAPPTPPVGNSSKLKRATAAVFNVKPTLTGTRSPFL